MKKGLCLALSISLLALQACGGRVADPVPVFRPGDEGMTCTDLKAEMAHIESEVRKLIPESKKTGKNVALGAAGVFLIFPWFFMDMSSAEKTEIRAYNERYLGLEKLYQKRCSAGGKENSAEASGTQMGAKERLKLLEQLRGEGLITEEEYQSRRKAILSSI